MAWSSKSIGSFPQPNPVIAAAGNGKIWSFQTGFSPARIGTVPIALFPQDRDHNAAQNILSEALRLIGLVDQAVTGIGSDELRHVTWQSITDAISI